MKKYIKSDRYLSDTSNNNSVSTINLSSEEKFKLKTERVKAYRNAQADAEEIVKILNSIEYKITKNDYNDYETVMLFSEMKSCEQSMVDALRIVQECNNYIDSILSQYDD